LYKRCPATLKFNPMKNFLKIFVIIVGVVAFSTVTANAQFSTSATENISDIDLEKADEIAKSQTLKEQTELRKKWKTTVENVSYKKLNVRRIAIGKIVEVENNLYWLVGCYINGEGKKFIFYASKDNPSEPIIKEV